MAWTAPRTWVTAEVVTAAQMNAHVRDNLLETAPAKVTTAGDVVYATAANTLTRLGIGAAGSILGSTGSAPVWRTAVSDLAESTSNATTSASFVDATAIGGSGGGGQPQVIITTGAMALVSVYCELANTNAGVTSSAGYRISGATTAAAQDARSFLYEHSNAADAIRGGITYLETGLTPGVNNFFGQVKTSGGTLTFQRFGLSVVAF